MNLPPLPDVFGNYALQDFREIVAPAAIDWLPQTPGWWVLGSVLLLWLVRRSWRRARHWFYNRYRGEAISRLDNITDIADDSFTSELNKLLKITALTAYSRPDVAMLTGDAWVNFLNAHCDSAEFVGEQASVLASGSYQPQTLTQITREELLQLSRLWILNHRRFEHD
ncbi:MAG: DUF4381 domain-containing protein [Halioglobus sp.]